MATLSSWCVRGFRPSQAFVVICHLHKHRTQAYSTMLKTVTVGYACRSNPGKIVDRSVKINSITWSILPFCLKFSGHAYSRHLQFTRSNFNQEIFQRMLSLSATSSASQQIKYKDERNNDAAVYICSAVIFMLGLSYAAVPLYRMFCKATGIGGDPRLGHNTDAVETMEPIRERQITVKFNADHHSSMEWNFKPSQREITVVPGETALAFYTAKNPTDKPIVGVATYNVVPFQAGLYFNKIQCFCFEEQWLNPHEEVDMPVFFYIDPEYDDDPVLANVDQIILSYTFFKAEQGQTIPLPGFMKLNSLHSPTATPV